MADLVSRTIFKGMETNPLESFKGKTSMSYTGMDDMVTQNGMIRYVSGHAFWYWVRLPEWFEQDEDLKLFRAVTQKNMFSFEGLSTVELGTTQGIAGEAGNTYDIVTNIERGNTNFTITYNEYSGSPMRRLVQKWIHYIRDPRTGIATYPKIFGVDYNAYTMSGEGLYIAVRPDANNNNDNVDILEHAMYYSNVIPKNYDLSQYNFTRGESETTQVAVEFSGVPDFGPWVDDYARKILKEVILSNDSDEEGNWVWVNAFDTTMDENTQKMIQEKTTFTNIYNPDSVGSEE